MSRKFTGWVEPTPPGKPRPITVSEWTGPSGRMSDMHLWNCALSPDQIRAIADGADPSTVRPESYVGRPDHMLGIDISSFWRTS